MNVSAHSLSDPSFYDYVEAELRRSGADPALLVFELTETALVQDQAATENFALRIHGLGCKLALDDFGTGYGGFTYLKQLPIDFLKIDIEFVRDLATNPASRHVVQAVVALARGFDLKTVAEGVEDARTLAMLREYGVDYAQGFHVGRPAALELSFD
jgi:EAL domain-containing protein (putative c-di-GMP-specific phosphodiesterase class I)